MTMIRLTMAQALTRYLAAQTSEVDGREVRPNGITADAWSRPAAA